MKTIVLVFAAAAGLGAQQFDVLVPAPLAPPVPPQVSISTNRTFMFVAGEMVGGSPVTGAPYSAEAVTESTQQLADGNKIVNRNAATIYRDSEGRERREQSLPNIGGFAPNNVGKAVFISDPVAKVNYSLDPQNKTAVKMPAPPMPPPPPTPPGAGTQGVRTNMAFQRMGGPAGVAVGIAGPGMPGAIPPVMLFHNEAGGPNQNVPTVDQMGSKLIEGVQATGTRTTITIPAGQMGNEKPMEITDERWFSQELKVTVYSEHNDPRSGKTVYSLKNISRAEPLPTVFQVPPDYTVTEPEMHIETIQK
jgi:hypothetical protein